LTGDVIRTAGVSYNVARVSRESSAHSRIEPALLIEHLPVGPRPSEPAVFAVAAISLIGLGGFLFGASACLGHPTYGIVAGGLTVVLAMIPFTTFVRRWLPAHQLRRARTGAATLVAEPGENTRVTGIGPGSWVCSPDEHKNRVRSGHAPAAGVAQFRFVIAAGPNGSATRLLAFADGTCATWHCSEKVWVRRQGWPYTASAALPAGDEKLVEHLVEQLDDRPGGTALTQLGLTGLDATRAAYAAIAWGLIEAPGRVDMLFVAARDSGADGFHGTPLRRTAAGSAWLDCGPRAEQDRRNAEERKRMASGRFEQNIHFHGSAEGVNIAQTTRSQRADVRKGPSADEVLAALREVLREPGIPWHEPELAAVRPTIEAAVDRADVGDSRLRAAVRKLVAVCGNLALGLAGNTLFEVLKRFAA
jgi:hypothetical protein